MPSFNFFLLRGFRENDDKIFPLTQYGCHTMWPMMSELELQYSVWGVPPMFEVSHRTDKRLQRKTF